jgi:hypothetical protein
MAAVYKFRVTFEDHDDVFRDIEIISTQTFEDLHHAIQQSIGFDASKPASFYMSDGNWTKGKEISLNGIPEGNKGKIPTMKSSRLCDFIADPHQRIYYVFDFSAHWSFYVELYKIHLKEEPGVNYPKMVKTAGIAPKQYGVSNLGTVVNEFDLPGNEEYVENEVGLDEEEAGTDLKIEVEDEAEAEGEESGEAQENENLSEEE